MPNSRRYPSSQIPAVNQRRPGLGGCPFGTPSVRHGGCVGCRGDEPEGGRSGAEAGDGPCTVMSAAFPTAVIDVEKPNAQNEADLDAWIEIQCSVVNSSITPFEPNRPSPLFFSPNGIWGMSIAGMSLIRTDRRSNRRQ